MVDHHSTVILVSGLQGTGKSTLARVLGERLGICVFSRDPFMKSLMQHGVPLDGVPERGVPSIPSLGYAIQTVILEQQLMLGSSVILECVMSAEIQQTWAAICQDHEARLLTVECMCSDRALHRDRIERRHRAGESPVTWEWVSRAPESYRTNPNAEYLADAVQPVAANVAEIVGILGRAQEGTVSLPGRSGAARPNGETAC